MPKAPDSHPETARFGKLFLRTGHQLNDFTLTVIRATYYLRAQVYRMISPFLIGFNSQADATAPNTDGSFLFQFEPVLAPAASV